MSNLLDITVKLHGQLFDAIAEYESEFEPADPEVGYFESSMSATVKRVVLVDNGRIVTNELDKKELSRIEDCCAQDANEGRESDAERRQAAKEDAWDARRKGE